MATNTETIPVMKFKDGFKLAKRKKSVTAFYFKETNSLLKLLTKLTGAYATKINVGGNTWYAYNINGYKVLIRGFGANQKVVIKPVAA